MISAKDLQGRLALTFLSYQLANPNEKEDLVQCAKTLDKILIWESEREEESK